MKITQKNKSVILRPSEIKSHNRGAGVSTIPLVTEAVGSKNLINGITTFAPGAAIPFHSHNCEESVMLLQGEAMLDIDGDSIPIQLLDTTWVPADVPQLRPKVCAVGRSVLRADLAECDDWRPA